ncbi:hypothetical protein F2P56_002009 [Juglans regia]|uniref:Homeobox-DDT domain protein RLT2-like n=1 Tax=Juglans regia TaxID=51240 RepID=A0A833Y9K3_JUGRE|nr:hypothetical protein F2P56_002009 [Juglans regia]
MEAAGSEGEKKKPPEGENKTKRKMKTASQLEILEKTYAVEPYPSEALRAELSTRLGLSDRQLQMWFCHRRLKDRKGPPVKRQPKDSPVGEEMVVGEAGNEHASGLGLVSSKFMESRRVVGRPGVAVARIGSDMGAMSRFYEPQQSIQELRAIAFVEAQLGEPLREDGPILGMEFDPLPPDAFGAPIGLAAVGPQKQSGRPFEPKLYEQPDAKSIKGVGRALHEYQFLPEQPTVRTDAYWRVTPSYHYGSPGDGPNARTPSLPSSRIFMHGNEHVPSGYGFQGQMPGLNLLPQQGKQGHLLPSASGENDNNSRKNPFTNITDAHFGAHPITQMENPFVSSDKRVILDEDVSRMERKRKTEEARIAREVEAHEKRIRKELEKQDILRRKREEQMRKEMERHDRDRRKEEERLLREKQREEERYQREQRRELERREKFLQKESIRVEKLRQKEEIRREKEAARLKAANERAIARRIAKESMELIEDERLELMELATSSKGLPSILSLDYETAQNLEIYRDMRTLFPPKLVNLKRPFTVQPWIDSEDNIGNLLMVWRFLITFVDVLGLWPFTLDEFVQAFHDYDPRLLGEIHVALLRSIIKDIEDVARTPSTGLGAIQNCAANPGGGHPLVIEGAYAWGFDICNWQRHLNPLTWPEILRQFALSAGFGPQLKRRNVEQTYLREDNEGNDGEDAISNLRNGAAVENAVAIMQERGFSNPRRSRHRLTPGTVKFAAFHVLSLEGSQGVTILEVAEKIQKSGLRDLTTSKTPEASIAAALSRDSKLFERTAPSTYCVRSAYRKDPADAEAILSSARERIRVFKSGIVDGEDADDAERDGDSESDAGEDPEVDDVGAEINPVKENHNSKEETKVSPKTPVGNGMGSDGIMENPQVDLGNIDEGLSSMQARGLNKDDGASFSVSQSVDVSGIGNNIAIVSQEDTDIDESNPGEPWVQGLIEGEYSDLSVEERLNALVALIGVAIEGNSIRIVLEERLEAANALKKQMWAEAQLDKRRMKEEFVMKMHYSSFMGNRTEPNLTASLAEGRQSSFPIGNDKSNEMSVAAAVQQELPNDVQNEQNYLYSLPSEENLQMQDYCAGPDNLPYQQAGYYAERSRSQLKSYISYKAEEMCMYRSLPLGQDRRHNRYWRFITSASRNDPGCGRIFVELYDGRWRLIDSEEVSIPPEALQPFWTDSQRESWGMKLQSSSSAEDLLQILTSLEGAIKRDYLSSNFESTSDLLDSSDPSGFARDYSSGPKTVPVLPWIPDTMAAVALRLMEFDSSISYMLEQQMDSQKDRGPWVIKLQSKYAAGKNSKDDGTAHTPYQAEHLNEENFVDSVIGLNSYVRGRGGRGRGRTRTRGGRSQRRVITSRAESGKRSTTAKNDRFGQVTGWKGRPRRRGGRGRGRRSIRSRQRSAKVVLVGAERNSPREIIIEKSQSDLVGKEWNEDETTRLEVEDAGNTSNSERSGYDDENGLATGDEYDDMVMDDYAPQYIGRSDDFLRGTYYDVDVEEHDDDNDGDENEEDEQGDLDVEEYINGDSDDEENGGDREQNVDQHQGAGYTSSEYSE